MTESSIKMSCGESNVIVNFFKETFISKDVLVSPTTRTPGKIEVFYKNGPFEYLNNHWIFHNYGKRRCKLVFFIKIAIALTELKRRLILAGIYQILRYIYKHSRYVGCSYITYTVI